MASVKIRQGSCERTDACPRPAINTRLRLAWLTAIAVIVVTSGIALSATQASALIVPGAYGAVPAITKPEDASPFIQKVWDTGHADLPCGTYRINTPLVAHENASAIKAPVAGCVTFDISFETGDVLTIANTRHVEITGIHFISSVRRMSGALIHVMHASFTEIQVSAEAAAATPFADEIVIDKGSELTRVSASYLANATGDCIRIDGNAIESYLTQINTASCGVGLHLHRGSGIYMDRLDLIGSSTRGLLIDPSAGESVNAVYGSTVLSDSSAMDGVVLGGTGDITELNVVGLWASDSGMTGVFTPGQTLNRPSHGILFDNPRISGVTLTGPRAKGNGGDGILINAGEDIQLLAPQALMNGSSYGTVPPTGGGASRKRFDGIRIAGAATNIIVSNPICGRGGWEGSVGRPNQQGWGLYREAGSGGQIVSIVNGIYSGNVLGTYVIKSSPGDHLNTVGNLP